MARAYDELSGGEGRKVYFRPRRYRARRLLGGMAGRVDLGDQRGKLYDVSLTGASVLIADETMELRTGDVLPIAIHVGGERAVSGRAEVVRQDEVDGRARWAVRFIDTYARPDTIENMRESVWFATALREGTAAFDRVPDAYRNTCHEAALVLRYWRDVANRRSDFPSLGRVGENEHAALSKDEQSILEGVRNEWNRIRERAAQTLDQVYRDEKAFAAAKRLTELVVTPLTLEGDIWSRAYRKPLGYPGDYLLMEYMYDDEVRGASSFGRVLHQLGREERLAATVNSRKELLVTCLRDQASRKANGGAGCLRLLSLGSGPSREIEEFLREVDPGLAVQVCLVDQDEGALAYAYERIVQASVERAVKVDVRCRHISFRDLFSRPELILELEYQDLVFSAGLFDYLREPAAQLLAEQLCSVVGPGGSLLIGNAADDPSVKWVPEFVLDWRMYYRTREDLLRLVHDFPRDAIADTVNDASGAWHFLEVKRMPE